MSKKWIRMVVVLCLSVSLFGCGTEAFLATLPRRRVLCGEYDFVASLGYDCHCATMLRKCGLRSCSSPLDWLTAAPLSGEGPAQITLTVRQTPGKSITNRDNYASRLSVQSECGGCEAVVALAKKGRYVNRHLNTGDPVTDVIAIALTQVGYTGGSNASELDGTPSGTPNDWTKYGAYMGINGNPWCACFLSWCAFQAGIPSSVLKPSTYARPHYFTPGVTTGAVRVYWFGSIPSSATGYNYLNRYGIRLTRTDPGWAPLPGDFIFKVL